MPKPSTPTSTVTLTSYALKLIQRAEEATSGTRNAGPSITGKKALGKCACGNWAYRKYVGDLACETCIRIEEKFMYETGKVGKRRTQKLGVDFYETGLTE